jgi:carbonic anhydrase
MSDENRKMIPEISLQQLKDGNERFQKNKRTDRNLLKEVHDTSNGQQPIATILHCIDSRVSAELIFDLGVGDVFSARVAGNIVNPDMLGSMEFANNLSTSRLIVVLGHTGCGAVGGTIVHAGTDNLTTLLQKIRPAIGATTEPSDGASRVGSNKAFVNRVAATNVRLTIENIRNQSGTLKNLESLPDSDAKRIKIVGGIYDISDGKVHWDHWEDIKFD